MPDEDDTTLPATRAAIPRDPDTALARADLFAALPDATHWCRAAWACQDHDGPALWELTASYLIHEGTSGAAVSPHTLRSYRHGALYRCR